MAGSHTVSSWPSAPTSWPKKIMPGIKTDKAYDEGRMDGVQGNPRRHPNDVSPTSTPEGAAYTHGFNNAAVQSAKNQTCWDSDGGGSGTLVIVNFSALVAFMIGEGWDARADGTTLVITRDGTEWRFTEAELKFCNFWNAPAPMSHDIADGLAQQLIICPRPT